MVGRRGRFTMEGHQISRAPTQPERMSVSVRAILKRWHCRKKSVIHTAGLNKPPLIL